MMLACCCIKYSHPVPVINKDVRSNIDQGQICIELLPSNDAMQSHECEIIKAWRCDGNVRISRANEIGCCYHVIHR